jgi:hypothetical protein
MTSGKVYEYAATGLPIVSVHEREHDAATVLADYPLWSRVDAVTADEVAAAFVRSAQQTVSATPEVRAAAREVAARYERRRLMEPAIAELAARTWTREAKQVTA